MNNVLIIEDDKEICVMIKDHLEKYNYQVFFTLTGANAIERIKELSPDLIILDLILYYTKAITILVVSLITYLIFVATFFVIEIIQSGYIPTASEVINLLGWALACGTVLLALESISIFLCVVIQNTGIVTGICCLYVFSGASVYLMLWSDMETVSIPLKIFVYGNPMYYWMNFSSCRTMGIIEHLPFYFIGCISLLIVGGLIMIRKEIK